MLATRRFIRHIVALTVQDGPFIDFYEFNALLGVNEVYTHEKLDVRERAPDTALSISPWLASSSAAAAVAAVVRVQCQQLCACLDIRFGKNVGARRPLVTEGDVHL